MLSQPKYHGLNLYCPLIKREGIFVEIVISDLHRPVCPYPALFQYLKNSSQFKSNFVYSAVWDTIIKIMKGTDSVVICKLAKLP